MPPSIASVEAAFLLFGGLNAGTPLLMASTPVSAVQPEVNARKLRKARAKPVKGFSGSITVNEWDSANRVSPEAMRAMAHNNIDRIANMKAYTGIAKIDPDSRTPRRFISVITKINPIARPTR